MQVRDVIRDARQAAGLTQKQLAALAGTSQPTVAIYESGRRDPSTSTLIRLVEACGGRLRIEMGHAPVRTQSQAELKRAGEKFIEVLDLAERLPTKHSPDLNFPRLPEAKLR
jgi:transcriptional regulator with XRE-family HTH domain